MLLEDYILSELKKKNVQVQDAFPRLGVSKQTFYNKIRAAKPKLDFLDKVQKSLDIDLSAYINGDQTTNSTKITTPIISDRAGAPYYNVDFKGGFDIVFNDQTIRPDFYINYPPFNDADGWVNVTGKSMGPLIAHGDIVALKRQDDWQDFLLEGEIYAIVTKNGFRTIKIIAAGKDDQHYTLRPYNKGEDFSPQPIKKDMIEHVFRVMGCIKKFF